MEDDLEERLDLLQSACEYLDVSGNLSHIREICERYNLLKEAEVLVYTFRIHVNLSDVFELSAPLGSLLMTSLTKARTLFQQVIHLAITILNLLKDLPSLPQISVMIRLTALPRLPYSNEVHTYKDLTRCHLQNTYVHFQGIIIGMSAVTKYTQSTRYICQSEECEGHTGNHFIRIHVPGASEKQIIRDDFPCSFCGEMLVEVKSQRIISDKVMCELVNSDYFASGCSVRDQAVPVHVRDDLTRILEIGKRYQGIGIIRTDRQQDKIVQTIEVINMMVVSPIGQNTDEEPESIIDLREGSTASPWSFPLTLAYYFGAHICPPGTYIKLKLAMLLSLLMDPDTADKPLHLLAVGKDTNILHKLLRYGQQFSTRTCLHSSGLYLTAKISNDRYNGAKYFIEGGSLFLARSGTCFLGDIVKYKKASKDTLQSVMSSGKISIDVASKYTDSLPHSIDAPLQCHLWAYMDSSSFRKPQHTEDLFTGCDRGDISKIFLDSFSILQYTDRGDQSTNEEVAIHSAEQILLEAMTGNRQSTHTLPISDDDIKQFIKMARKLKPIVTEEADRLIQGYFIASRKARCSNNSVASLPMLSLPSLISMARSFAKMSMVERVTERDALMAIRLYEESMTARYGYSVLSVLPSPHVSTNCVDQFFGKQMDSTMQQFHVHLLRFCTSQSTHEE